MAQTDAPRSSTALDVPFVGREADLAELCALVADPAVEVVELVGEPGVGKSRLARELLDVVGERADVVLVDDAHTLTDDDRARRIAGARGAGRTVVVTDRRESTAATASYLLCPLPVPDDYSLLDVDAATQLPAVDLLVALRRTVQPSFVLDATTLPTAARVAAHVRGVPRDLRVASTLLTTVGPVLTTTPATTRSPTVTALLAGSRAEDGLDATADVVARLSDDARRVLAAAALGADGLGRHALARITDIGEPDLTRATAALSELGLLVGSERASAGPTGVVLARFHVPVSALPVAAAATTPDLVEAFADRCTEHHLDVVDRALVAIAGRDQAAGFAMLHAEQANVAAALDRLRPMDPGRAVDTVLRLRTYWRVLGLVFDIQEQLERLTELEDRLDLVHAARLALALADAEARLGEPELAAESLHRAQQLAVDDGGTDVLVTRGVLGLICSTTTDDATLLDGARALRDAGRTADADRAVLMVALHALFAARPADAAALCREVLPDARRRGDHVTSGAALLRLAACATANGDAVGADEYWSRAMVHLRPLGLAVTLGQIAEVVASCVEPSSRTRAVRLTQLLGAVTAERATVATGVVEPAFIVGAFEERMLQVLGPVDFAQAWTHGRATTPAELVAAFARDVVAGATALAVAPVVLEPVVVEQIAPVDDRFARWSDLTPREEEVALLVARGLSNRQAARRLSISEWTVVNHMRAVLKKLGLRSRVQLARWEAEREAVDAGTAAGTDVRPVPATDPV